MVDYLHVVRIGNQRLTIVLVSRWARCLPILRSGLETHFEGWGGARGGPKGRTRGGAMGGGRGGRNGWDCLFGNTISAAIHYNVSPCKCE